MGKMIKVPVRYNELSFAEQGMLEYMANDGYDGFSLDKFSQNLPDSVHFIKKVLDNLISLGYVILKENNYYINQERMNDSNYYRTVVI